MNPPPPMPHDCGRATLRPKMIDAAASLALPPRSSTERPMADAMGDSVATMPPGARVAGRYIEPSLAGAAVAASRKRSAPAVALQRPSVISSGYAAGAGGTGPADGQAPCAPAQLVGECGRG